MVILNLILFLVFLAILIKCADYAIKYSSGLANILRFPEFVVSFFIIALVSVLPEATISIISAINGESELGLGTLLGSSVADLTLVLGIVSFFSRGGIEVKSRILKNNLFYLILLAFPLILGFDGRFSRIDGLILVLVGGLFFGKLLMKKNKLDRLNNTKKKSTVATILLLILSVAILLVSAFLTVKYAVNFANDVKLPTILIGLTILAFGICLPELIFSIKAVMKNHDELALGDILGTVIANVTIILGIVALISPFNHSFYDLYVTGTAMLFAGFLVTSFMKSKKTVNRFEGLLLILFYVLFLFAEFFVNKIFG